ncbi:interferon-induced protein with tetratricopeptide repeats 1-like isoform X2 [Narcine bancroftii]|uniref:interferon-induced protein with tetratricopeptide repeats 1-like isoform X2 n=1 Tax=Narcine bancroftii TaxID=1343680 RepID=UPI00383216E6
MSDTPEDILKGKLDQLQCHLTWSPQKGSINLDDIMYRLQDSISLGVKYKARSYNHLAFVNCLQGNYEEAIQNLKEAEKVMKENHKDEFERRSIVTYGNYAWVHYHMGQLTEAQSYLDKLEMICKPLTDGPRYTAMIPEVYGEKGWSLMTSGAKYYEEARECFEEALKKDPENTEWIMGCATVLFRLEAFSGTPENLAQNQSVKYLQCVLKLDPDNSMAMVLLALKFQSFNEKENAAKLVEQALQKTSDLPYVLRYAAKFYRQGGNMEKAVKLLKQALELTPRSCFLNHQIAICYKSKLMQLLHKPCKNVPDLQLKTELINQCRYHFEQCLHSAIKPQLDFAKFWTRIGEISKSEEIYSHLVKLVDIRPENMQKICLEAGLFELHHKNSESNAISLFLKGLKIDYNSREQEKCHRCLEWWADMKLCTNPCDSKALGIKGLLYQLVGNKSKAIEYFKRALEIDGDNEDYRRTLYELGLSIKGQNDA